MSPTLRRTASWVTLIQLLLNLNWALYVAFLPALMVAAGMDPRLATVLLMVDQATFVASDWAAGVYADRLARVIGRIGPSVALFAIASSAALLALPWLARLGMPALLVAATLAWAVTSSALRAPVFTLLGRFAGAARPPGAISLALTGIGVAGAIAPLVTQSLARVDPRLPLGIGALTLAIAAMLVSRLERAVPEPAPRPTGSRKLAASGAVALIALVAAIGTQIHTVSLVAPLKAEGVTWVAWWAPVFWTGFALGTVVAAWLSRTGGEESAGASLTSQQMGTAALLVGAVALVLAPVVPGFEGFVPLQALAGAGWAVFMSAAVRTALAAASGSGAGGPVGMIFSALAAAALARLALGASGWQPTLDDAWIPAATWLLAASAFALRPRAR